MDLILKILNCRNRIFGLLIVLMCLPFLLTAQSIFEQIGKIPLTAYSPDEYGGAPMVWSVLQSNDGLMYFGNSSGIAEYDGVSWHSLFKTNQSISTYSLTKDDKGQIFYAGRDFGYLDVNHKNGTKPISLLHLIPEELREGFKAWEIHFLQGSLLIRSGFENIIRLELADDMSLKSLKSWQAETSFGKSFVVGNNFYVRQAGKGLFTTEGEELKLIPNTAFFGGIGMTIMCPYPDESGKSLLIGGQTTGFYVFDGMQPIKLPTGIDQDLENGVLLHDAIPYQGNYIVALLGGGVVVMNQEGKILKKIGIEQGLSTNVVSQVYLDQNKGLWATTDDGIAKIAIASPILTYGKELEINSAVWNILKKGEELYLGTSTSFLKFDHSKKKFLPVPGVIPRTMFDFIFDGEDLIVPGVELQVLRNGKRIRLYWPKNEEDSRYVLVPINNPNLLLVGGHSGLFIYRRGLSKESPWDFMGKIPDIGLIEDFLMEGKDGTVFMRGMDKLYALDISDWSRETSDMANIKTTHLAYNAAKDLYSLVDGEFFTFSDKGFQKYSPKEGRLIPAEEFSEIEDDLLDFYQPKTGPLWYESTDGSMYFLKRNASNKFIRDDAPSAVRPFLSSVGFLDEDSIMWYVSAKDLVRYDAKKDKQIDKTFFTLIRRIQTETDTLSLTSFGRDRSLPKRTKGDRFYRFEFAAPYFEEEKKTKYQTYLEGLDAEWGDWNDNTFKEYTNLSPGPYTFRVRAIAYTGIISEEAVFSFVVLPPWYATWWAYLIYVILLGGMIATIIKWRTQTLKAENRILEERVIDRTKALEKSLTDLKSTQALLIHSEKMASLGELTSGIAHEIQNPLNFVNNFSELSVELADELKEELSKIQIDPSQKVELESIANDIIQNQQKINHHGKRAESIVKGMLQHSRSGSGKKELTDLNALADEYLRLSYHGLRAKDKSFLSDFKADLDPHLPKLEVMPQDIGRVLLNLINNAFYAVNEKKKKLLESGDDSFKPMVKLKTQNLGNCVEISVADNGGGIPEHIKDKIFQPFFTTKPTGQGTGLGLSLSYDIVKAHGGELKVKSQSLSQAGLPASEVGTEFVLVLHTNN
jgi:signal transduction histidine kinase